MDARSLGMDVLAVRADSVCCDWSTSYVATLERIARQKNSTGWQR
jgi:hypothetical protein